MSPERRGLTLLVNPSAGRGRAGRILPQVSAALVRSLPEVALSVVRATDFAEADAGARACVAAARPGDALIVMGGDGMMGLGMDAVAGTGVPLGLIPAGTGNDICRGLGIPTHPLAAARLIARGRPRPVDAIAVRGSLARGGTERFVGSVVASGFDARVNRRANHIRLPIGSLRYAASALAELATFEPLHYKITIDGRLRELPAMFVAVANTAYYGGGMQIAPGADPSDGMLDVTVIHPVSRFTLLRLLPTMYGGSFVRDPSVERFRTPAIDIDGAGLYAMGDGEELGPPPLSLRADPGALLVYAP
ncbi:diacylglycerol/lipid kinase family protein [Naumannella huperziae]